MTSEHQVIQQLLADAEQFGKRGDLASAELMLRKALCLAPKCVPALHAIAGIAAGKGRKFTALDYLERAIRHTPQKEPLKNCSHSIAQQT